MVRLCRDRLGHKLTCGVIDRLWRMHRMALKSYARRLSNDKDDAVLYCLSHAGFIVIRCFNTPLWRGMCMAGCKTKVC